MNTKKLIKEFIPYLIIIIVVVLVRSFLFTTVRVNGDSMETTLHDGNVMILDKINVKLNGIDRFDIIVFNTSSDKKLIKRVIGLPGESIECRDNKIYVNGKEINNSYATGKTTDFDLITIPKDNYYVLGDNRENSVDSRVIGTIDSSNILGHAIFTIYPFKDFGDED